MLLLDIVDISDLNEEHETNKYLLREERELRERLAIAEKTSMGPQTRQPVAD